MFQFNPDSINVRGLLQLCWKWNSWLYDASMSQDSTPFNPFFKC